MEETHYYMKAGTAWTLAHWFQDPECWDDSLKIDGVPPSLALISVKEEGKVQFHFSNINRFSDFAMTEDHTSQRQSLEEGKQIKVQIQLSADSLQDKDGKAASPSAIHNQSASSSQNKSSSSTKITKKQHVCSICEKSFRYQSELVIHLRTHSIEKPFQCPRCGKSFSQKSHLKQHQRIHNNEKPYACSTCGRSFTQNSNLKTHLLTHVKRLTPHERPHKCEHCGKCFSQKGNLDRHTRTHTGEKPYSCQTCGKRFAHSTQLIRHSRKCVSTAAIKEEF